MTVANEADLAGLLACPACRAPLRLSAEGGETAWLCDHEGCRLAARPFPRVAGKSVLVDFDNSILDPQAIAASGAASLIRRRMGWQERLIDIVNSKNRIAPHFARDMLAQLERRGAAEGRRPRLLVVGGGTVGQGAEPLYETDAVEIIAFDIYCSDLVDVIADGHAMPLVDGSVDGVWIQAVLEHVADPAIVVGEIHRVLRPGGLVFADTPFLWPVHEKAWDFTRWTPSGHRWLFRGFDVIAAGTSSGPGTLLLLAIRNLAAALFRSSKAGHLATLPFFWVRFLDDLCDPRRALDGAAGIFLYGRRSDRNLDVRELVAFYDAQVPLEEQVPGFRKSPPAN